MIDESVMKIILCLIAVSGYLYNTNKRYLDSYILWIISNTGWAIFSYLKDEYQLMTMFIIYNLFCIYGIYKQLK